MSMDMKAFKWGISLLVLMGSVLVQAQTTDEKAADSVIVVQDLIDIKSVKIDDNRTVEKQAINQEKQRAFRCSFLTLDNLAKVAGGVNQAEALDCLNTLLVNLDTRPMYLIPVNPNHCSKYSSIRFSVYHGYLDRPRKNRNARSA
jgi:hypothetical protein